MAALKDGTITHAMLPLENSHSGAFVANYKVIEEKKLKMVGEYVATERHLLLALPKTQPSNIKEVRYGI